MKRQHRMSHRPEYVVWSAMRSRCNNVRHKNYSDYGGRGIKVCAAWGDFAVFMSDMGSRPSSLHTIDRIDNNGDYTPTNCRWATRAEQSVNKRNTRMVEYRGKLVCLAGACDEAGISVKTVRNRIDGGWAVTAAIDVPTGKPGRRFRAATRTYRTMPKGSTNSGFAPGSTASSAVKQ